MNEPSLKEIIKIEYKKCALDPVYFLTKYSYIQHPIRGRVLFDLYNYQKNTLEQFEDIDYNIVLKGRQIGISTLVAGYSLWMLLFHSDKNILVIATKQETAKNLVTKVRYMHANLPVWLRGTAIEDNKLSMRFANGSQIKAVARSKDAGRSEALSLLILDEAAFIDGADEIWTAAQATLSTGGKAILLSTPNGVGNFFHKMWLQAEEGSNNFNPILLDWRVHPERDQEWRDRQTEILGEMQSSQEHDASFIFSGNTVVNPEIIEFYRNTFVQEPLSKQGFDGNLWIWEYPNATSTYIAAADVARGDGMDYSTIHIIDAERSIQVAEYKGKLPTKEFGNLMVSLATEYNDALLIPDNSSIGWNSIQQVIDRGYKNLFYMSSDLHYVDVENQIVNRNIISEKNLKPGFTISMRTRPLIIGKLEEYMREQSITIRSIRTVTELETFIWKNGRAEALDGYNDDLVMALGIGLWVRDTALRLRQEGIELTKLALDRSAYSAMPYIGSKGYHQSGLESDPYAMNLGGEKVEDISWLIR
jgi:hypothetical protein